ncbi:hypothetical protein CCP3SC1AL1_250015 [Gammaproteobacteria bacterium]
MHAEFLPIFTTPRAKAPPKYLAGGLGLEPRLAESESAVLPLDDPPEIKHLELECKFLS